MDGHLGGCGNSLVISTTCTVVGDYLCDCGKFLLVSKLAYAIVDDYFYLDYCWKALTTSKFFAGRP